MARLDLPSRKDQELKPLILAGDWAFVTKNSADFRGPAERPGTNCYPDSAGSRKFPLPNGATQIRGASDTIARVS